MVEGKGQTIGMRWLLGQGARLVHLRQACRCAEQPQGQRRITAHDHSEVNTMMHHQGAVGGRDIQRTPLRGARVPQTPPHERAASFRAQHVPTGGGQGRPGVGPG